MDRELDGHLRRGLHAAALYDSGALAWPVHDGERSGIWAGHPR